MSEEVRRFRYFGPDTELTLVARAIMDEDISYLQSTLDTEWFLNEPLQYCQYGTGLAIQLALVESKHLVIDYLLSKNVDLNVPRAPAIVSAVSSLDTALIDKIIASGADIRARNNVGYDALDQAVAWEHFQLIPYLESKGLGFQGHKGAAFDTAVLSGNLLFVERALRKGANPNRNLSRNQGGSGETPLHTAVLQADLNMVKLLIQFGANPTRTNVHGQRPYHWAISNEKSEISEYLRTLEPAAYHDPKKKRKLAKKYHVPSELLAYLERDDRRLRTSDGQVMADLLPLADLYEFRWMRGKYIMVSRIVEDNYACGEIVWCKKRRSICIIDIEHDELFDMGSWDKFASAPATAIERIWSGELDTE